MYANRILFDWNAEFAEIVVKFTNSESLICGTNLTGETPNTMSAMLTMTTHSYTLPKEREYTLVVSIICGCVNRKLR